MVKKVESKNNVAPVVSTPKAEPLPKFTYEKWTGGSIDVDGWWTPEQGVSVEGILVGYISKDRSPKLKSDQLCFELIADLPGCRDARDLDKEVTLKRGSVVAFANYKSLDGIFPAKLGYACMLTYTGDRPIAGQSPMKLFDVKTSTKPVRAIASPEPAGLGNDKVPFET